MLCRLVFPIAGVPEGEPLLVELFDKDFRAKEFLGQVGVKLHVHHTASVWEHFQFSSNLLGEVQSGLLWFVHPLVYRTPWLKVHMAWVCSTCKVTYLPSFRCNHLRTASKSSPFQHILAGIKLTSWGMQVMMTVGKALEIAADPVMGQQYW